MQAGEFRAALDNHPDGFAVLSVVRDPGGSPRDFRIEYLNRAGERVARRLGDSPFSLTLLELLRGSAGEALVDTCRAALQSNAPVCLQIPISDSRDGAPLRVHIFDIRAVRLGEWVALAWRDLAALQPSGGLPLPVNAYSIALAEYMSDLVWTMDLQFRLTYVSPGVTALLGYNSQEIFRLNLSDLVTPASLAVMEADKAEFQRQIEQGDNQLAEAGARTYELEHIRKDGSRVWMEVRLNFLANLQGRTESILCVSRDISRRKQAEQALIESEERFRTVYELTSNFAFAFRFDPDGAIRREWVIGSFSRITGYPMEQLGDPEWAAMLQPEDVGRFYQWLASLRTSRQASSVEVCIRRKDGELRWIEAFVQPIWDEAAQQAGRFIGAGKDVTEKRQAEIAEREQRLLAEALREIAAALTGVVDPGELLDRILANIGRVVPHDASTIMLVDGEQVRVARTGGSWPDRQEQEIAALSLHVDALETLRRMSATRRSLVVPDTAAFSGWMPLQPEQGIRSYAGAPIVIKNQVAGFVNVTSTTPGYYGEQHRERLQALADLAAVSIENARLFDDVQRYARQAVLLNDLTRAALTAPDFPRMLDQLADRLGELSGADGVYISLWESEAMRPRMAAAYGSQKSRFQFIVPAPGEPTLTQSALVAGQPLVVDDIHSSPLISSRTAAQFPERSMLALPLISDERWLGAALVGYRRAHVFSPGEIALCQQAASQIALAISKAQHLEAERQHAALLSRNNSLIVALGIVALQLVTVPSLDVMFDTLGSELRKLGVMCLVALKPETGGEGMVVRYISIASRVQKMLEKYTGWKDGEYRMTRQNFMHYDRVIGEQEAEFSTEPYPRVDKYLPGFPQWIAERIFRLLGISAGSRWIYLPLLKEGQTIGMMWMWGADLERSDLTAARLFANQVSVALENTRLYAEVQQVAITDDLTQLYNRRGLNELGQREVERAIRFHRPLSALMIDIDHFKHINDENGHHTGDEALASLAGLCRQVVREVDVLGRYGGEEFVVLLTETDLNAACQVAERLRQVVMATPVNTGAGPLALTVSIGASSLGADTPDLEALVRKADRALYRAKRAGRNCVRI